MKKETGMHLNELEQRRLRTVIQDFFSTINPYDEEHLSFYHTNLALEKVLQYNEHVLLQEVRRQLEDNLYLFPELSKNDLTKLSDNDKKAMLEVFLVPISQLFSKKDSFLSDSEEERMIGNRLFLEHISLKASLLTPYISMEAEDYVQNHFLAAIKSGHVTETHLEMHKLSFHKAVHFFIEECLKKDCLTWNEANFRFLRKHASLFLLFIENESERQNYAQQIDQFDDHI